MPLVPDTLLADTLGTPKPKKRGRPLGSVKKKLEGESKRQAERRRKLAGTGNKAGPTSKQTAELRDFVQAKAVDPEWAGLRQKTCWARVRETWLPRGLR